MSSHTYLLKVKKIVRETADAVSVYFHQPVDRQIMYKPGQFLTLILTIDGEKIRRAYSLCTSPFVDSELAVTIKAVEKGKMSNYVNQYLKEGDIVEVLEPMGNFTTSFDLNQSRHLILIGGGSGITPLMSLALSTLHAEPKSYASLIYANRNKESIIFYNQLDELKKIFPDRFHLAHILEHPPVGWTGHNGFIHYDLVQELIHSFPDLGVSSTDYFICGPEGMMQKAVEILQKIGVPKEKIHKESFAASTHSSKSTHSEFSEKVDHQVKVIYDSQEYVFVVPAGKTILDSALSNNIDLPYSCQSGLCTACRGKCISGKVRLDEEEGLSDSELREGYVLTCVGHPLTDDVVIEIG